jgi:hypothetical protein
MKKSKLDLMFEKMSRECANSMNGTHPPKPKQGTKKAVRKTTKKK